MKRDFILRDDGVLCLDGYPLAIRRIPGNNSDVGVPYFELLENGARCGSTFALHDAMARIRRMADDIDTFTPA